jgi:transposase
MAPVTLLLETPLANLRRALRCCIGLWRNAYHAFEEPVKVALAKANWARAPSELIESGWGFPNRRWRDSSFRPDWRPAGMAEPLSMDLRTRVLAAVADGASGRRVGDRFGVSAASVSRWRALERTQGDASPKALGGDRRSQKTETHAPAILSAVEETPDITIEELRQALAKTNVVVSYGALWRFLDRHKITRKKSRRMRASRIARTS